jgi:phospholipid-binding lipoprotein MlaA
MTKISQRALAILLVALLVGLSPARAQERDPLEPVNRAVFEFNEFIDALILVPVAHLYRVFIPRPVREGVGNVLSNASSPVILANDLLQGEWERAEVTFGRFMLNTIIGVGGLVDVATMVGMPEGHYEDFGQTLAVYGVGEGPYLMLPLFGPSNPRDLAGRVVDIAFDPIALFAPTEATLSRSATEGVQLREQNIETVDELRRTSLDFYAAVRTWSRQLRAAEIRQGRPGPLEDIYDDFYDLDDPADLDDAP